MLNFQMKLDADEIREIHARVTPQSTQNFQCKDSHLLMQELLEKGCYHILLKGAIIEPFCGYVYLFVEEDIKFLIQAYLHLEDLVIENEFYQHGTCLANYRFSIIASSSKDGFTLELEYYPDGTNESLIHQIIDISKNEYLWWWRNIASEIISILKNYSILLDK